MRKFLCFVLVTVYLVACKSEHSRPRPILALPQADEYLLRTDRDTVLTTKGGARLIIPAGALEADSAGFARLEMIEAWKMEDMIRYGLNTMAGRNWLSSGGMFRISQHGKALKKPLTLEIDTHDFSPKMQLYRGDSANGKLNWVNPTPLQPVDSGYVLFQQNCASCHAMDKVLTGPSLGRITERLPYSEETMPYYEHHEGDHTSERFELYRCELNRMYGHIGPRTTLNRARLSKVVDYIERKSDSSGLPHMGPSAGWLGADSCVKRNAAINALQHELDSLIMADTQPSAPTVSGSYTVTLPAFGWYNLDYLYITNSNLKPASIYLNEDVDHDSGSVTLFIPKCKTHVGGELKEGKYDFRYGFDTLKLPLGYAAFIIGVENINGQMRYGLTKFVIGRKNQLTLKLKPGSQAAFDELIRSLHVDQWDLQQPVPFPPDPPNEKVQSLQQAIDSLSRIKIAFPCNCYGGADTIAFEFAN